MISKDTKQTFIVVFIFVFIFVLFSIIIKIQGGSYDLLPVLHKAPTNQICGLVGNYLVCVTNAPIWTATPQ